MTQTRRILLVSLTAVVAIGATIACVAYLFMSRYIQREPETADAAAREFALARARFAGQTPLIEYRGFDAPVIHRGGAGAGSHGAVHTFRLFVYDARKGEVARVTIPVETLRLLTVGGHLRVFNAGFGNGTGLRITLDDLQRFGPGLVLDSGRGMPGQLAVADALLGTDSSRSLVLIWTE